MPMPSLLGISWEVPSVFKKSCAVRAGFLTHPVKNLLRNIPIKHHRSPREVFDWMSRARGFLKDDFLDGETCLSKTVVITGHVMMTL